MDILLHKLGVSVKHLSILHQVLSAHYQDYQDENRRIEALGLEILARQLYAGGKVGLNVERQMILADIFQYIFVGRGYFAAVESQESTQKFIELLLRVANLLIMQENLSVDHNLRSILIHKLEANIDENDFFEPGYPTVREDLEALKRYDGWIVGDAGDQYDNIFDSLLPKRLGLAVEQNTRFSLVTSIPLFSVRLGDHRQPQPLRCGSCGRWITYSSYVIQGLIDGNVSTDVDSANADAFLRNELPNVAERDLAFYRDAVDRSGVERKLRYHYLCVRDQDVVKDRIEGRTRHHSTGLILPVPFVKGLEILKED